MLKNRLAFYKSEAAKCGADWREYASAKNYLSRSPFKGLPVHGAWHDGKKRWIENTNAIGLRFVCYADQELQHLRRTGYFGDYLRDQIIRGAVWQLPARDGSTVYVYGYEDPNNARAALVEFDITDDKREAAKRADSLAEYAADESREFYAKDAEERDIEAAREKIHSTNRDALELIKEIKQAGQFTPAVCGALRSELRRMLSRRKDQFGIIRAREDNFWSAVESY